MEKFDLIVDEKVAVWRRSYITVEADTLEDAVNDCIERGSDAALDTLDSRYIEETEECIDPSEDEYPTVEVMDRHYKILGNNDIFSK